jgi:hypothetical protein
VTPEEIAKCRAKPFPVMTTRGSMARFDAARAGRALDSVPWYIADRAWRAYDAEYRCGQTAERLFQRGGFAISELDAFYPEWRTAAAATAMEILDHVQALAAHPDPAVALAAIRETLDKWR